MYSGELKVRGLGVFKKLLLSEEYRMKKQYK